MKRWKMSFRKNELSPAESLYIERKNLLNEKSDFYTCEAYKSLRTNVMFSLTEESSCKVIMVTSSMPGEGKSITTTNLAISFAQTDKRVLLVDCDMRKPKISRLLEIKSDVGLSNVLLQPELSGKAIQESGFKNLKVLPAGAIPPNPSELLGSRRMQKFLEAMKEQFDYIFLDTPPVNVVTDAVVLISNTDGALFVIRSGRAERGGVRRAVDQLERADGRLLGFVLNGVESSGGSGYGKYRQKADGYGYGYGYGERGTES